MGATCACVGPAAGHALRSGQMVCGAGHCGSPRNERQRRVGAGWGQRQRKRGWCGWCGWCGWSGRSGALARHPPERHRNRPALRGKHVGRLFPASTVPCSSPTQSNPVQPSPTQSNQPHPAQFPISVLVSPVQPRSHLPGRPSFHFACPAKF
jgi:hypothetical protein